MPIVLSLQGSMAVGKTTAAQYLSENASYVHVSFEENSRVIRQVKDRKLNKSLFEDYIEIQKLWIQNEILRYRRTQAFDVTVMDFGAEEIEFYTVNYPKTIGVEWPVENALRTELRALRTCMPNRILFLDADDATLKARKENDKLRSRTFFEYQVENLLPLKKKWFFSKGNVDVLHVDRLTREETGERVREWVDRRIAKSAL